MVPALIRDSFFGQLVYELSKYRLFQYSEEQQGYPYTPDSFALSQPPSRSSSETSSRTSVDNATLSDGLRRPDDEESRLPNRVSTLSQTTVVPEEKDLAAQQARLKTKGPESPQDEILMAEAAKPEVQQRIAESRIVSWYGPEDPDNPQNWSLRKKSFVTFEICLLTFSIYIGSAIYAPGIGSLSTQFGVSPVAGTLGLTIFVIGYGVGPMFLSPLSELPALGRTTVYILSLAVFVALQVPTALAKNLGALLPLRFLAGFMGSPALATGGASLADMWALEHRAVTIGLWSVAAVCGPVLGPLAGGFAAQAEGWTWTIWMLLWLGGFTLIFFTFFLPETSAATILYRRARRLRRVFATPTLKSEGEIEAESLTAAEMVHLTLVRPFVLGFVEPIVIFWNLYISLVYGILYIFIESFRVVFVETHGFNLGQNGLAFLGLFSGALFVYICFVPYAIRVLKPKLISGEFVPEDRLPIAMVGAVLLPISMFWFGWTSGASVHWIVPIIASAFFSAGTFLLFQAGLNYLPDCYPRFVASVLAGNDFFRSMVGAAFPLFSTAFFHNLGVGPACSILGGAAILMLPAPFLLYKYGARVRAWSKYAGTN
ncbi:hypothetical protein PHLGIDRAFT_130975 [Phlebiopsis gigantea 11061_1 CR5-6]|uniref:Major facilitator superfamily (MFS) profile domain-containing protein n=1 Tax=Phlebiopsis gigantea (strain 11061_1 CR5-6) TaxID=745531 RepID=A0A0C3RZQ6_PHLG1|nr:hypothetical protein PHLGIDRAFT_130975 [Phlebiopsis gigantea 11061_1 CR5-6]